MSKLGDALRKLRVFNHHEMLARFGEKGRDVCVIYTAQEPRTCRTCSSAVYSPSFKTNPTSAWYDYGKKTFVGNRAESFPKAIQWAVDYELWGQNVKEPAVFTAAQMQAYARAALASLPEAAQGEAQDAARYRWLRQQAWWDGALFVVRAPAKPPLGTDCPSLGRLDEAIDAAIAAERKEL